MRGSSRSARIGLKRGTVRLQSHHPEWARSFAREQKRLLKALGPLLADLQHVGSTAIPGVPAKPIIDIAVAISSLKRADEAIKIIESLGYEYRADRGGPGRLFFTRGPESRRTHYLHLMEYDNEEWKSFLLFRDYLRTHKQYAAEYADLKRKLAREFGERRGLYTGGKEEFVRRVVALALKEDKKQRRSR